MLEDSNATRIVLEQLASQAILPDMIENSPSLPPGWVLLKTFSARFSPPSVIVQGFIAKGPINSNGDIAAALSLGITWEDFLGTSIAPFDPTAQAELPAQVTGTGNVGKVLNLFASAYNNVRGNIWEVVTDYLSDLPLYICGMSLGGPIAQIAALDLRPGNTGPSKGQKSPDTQPAGYVFSTANYGNTEFATYFNNTVSDQFNFRAYKSTEAVDLFPTEPSDSLYAAAGEVVQLNISIPEYDVPWLERSDVFYLEALGGTPVQQPPQPGFISNPPSDFSQTRAYAFSQLVAAAYAFAQHPGSVVNTSPYNLEAIIESNGAPFAYIFTSVTDVVVAVRGTTTGLEFLSMEANSSLVATDFNPDNQAQVHKGAYSVYTGPVSSTDSTSFSDKLLSTVSSMMSGRKLWLTGHGFGGALANIAAADYAMNPGKGLEVSGVYTFGSNAVANSIFKSDFDQSLSGKSFQILRLKDRIPTSIGVFGTLFVVGDQLVLNGQLAVDESTYHSLDGYIRLTAP
ncbi:hypothetical protein BTA51_14540 [Hahella sp. CCB-MM4]|uniref:lipase family protein n=1 Tax=Hahella sp. (strain CCB-MM4) TaxID=1926491 RepID=UPI000B9B0AC7|nr:hypothetical protein [Hahella sp. CCB-MM4]OZG72738.1 hypothetical protein BTA51_14540 [Hahella sp. CCB-MM4]